MNTLDLGNLNACIDDSKNAWSTPEEAPEDTADWEQLRAQVQEAQAQLPLVYRQRVSKPFLRTLSALTPGEVSTIQQGQGGCASVLRAVNDISQAIRQRRDERWQDYTYAFQEVVSDLYDGFLSAEDRRGIKAPERATIAPLVKWGSKHQENNEPYTFTARATAAFGVKTGVVNLPASFMRRGLVYWAMLGHETSGHDILQADIGLLGELRERVREAIAARTAQSPERAAWFGDYWSRRLEEIASDALGILNMGPAAVLAFIIGFKGKLSANGRSPVLSSADDAADIYPCHILRGYFGAEVVRLLGFSQAGAWANELIRIIDRDAGSSLILGGQQVPLREAFSSAQTVAWTLVHTKLRSLEDHALLDIQDWKDHDERILIKLEPILSAAAQPFARLTPEERGQLLHGTYAAHVVAGAVRMAVKRGANIERIQRQMVDLLAAMHRKNPAWCALQVVFPGDMSMRLAFPSV